MQPEAAIGQYLFQSFCHLQHNIARYLTQQSTLLVKNGNHQTVGFLVNPELDFSSPV